MARNIPNSEPHELEIDVIMRNQRGEKLNGNPKEGEPGQGKQADRLFGAQKIVVEYKKVSNRNSVKRGVKDAIAKEGIEELVFYTGYNPEVTVEVIRSGINSTGKDVSIIKKWWICDGITLKEMTL